MLFVVHYLYTVLHIVFTKSNHSPPSSMEKLGHNEDIIQSLFLEALVQLNTSSELRSMLTIFRHNHMGKADPNYRKQEPD